MKKFLPGSLLLLVTLLVPSAQAQVDSSSILFVAPSRVIMPSSENTSEINVSNKSNEPRRYDIAVVDQIMGEDGLTRRVETFDYSAKRMLRFVPKRFTLQPGDRQVVRVMAKRDPAMADGDYHSHLLFREVPLGVQDKNEMEEERKAKNGAQFEIRALYGIAVPIIVQKGNIVSDVSFGDASYIPASDGTPAHIAVELLRSGNAEVSATLQVKFTSASGQVSDVVKQQWIPIYREVDKITRRIPLNGLPEGTVLQGGKIVLEMSKDGGEDGAKAPVVTKEINF